MLLLFLYILSAKVTIFTEMSNKNTKKTKKCATFVAHYN